MDVLEAMKERHSVRSYTEQPLSEKLIMELQSEIDACNQQSGLSIQLVINEPNAFSGIMAHYGKFINVRNYIALVGKKGPGLDEAIGYYGERIILRATMLGLDTCWVGLTYNKRKCGCIVAKDETLRCVISIGYGKNHGLPHRSKPLEALCKAANKPEWFRNGMKAAMLAPTATNQQKFFFTLMGETVNAEATGGFYSKVDLGIVKYHFELGAGIHNFKWR